MSKGFNNIKYMKLISKILSIAIIVMPVSAFAAYTVTGVNADVNATVGHETSSDSDTNAVVNVNMDLGGEGEGTVTVTSDDDFDAHAETVTASHAEVQAVDVDADGSVDVAYKHQGWLFGFIPVMVTSHTKVVSDADGKAKAEVRLPWWSFLVSGVSKVQADTEAALNADAAVQANASMQTDTSARVKMLDAIISSLSSVDAKVKASWNLKENVK